MKTFSTTLLLGIVLCLFCSCSDKEEEQSPIPADSEKSYAETLTHKTTEADIPLTQVSGWWETVYVNFDETCTSEVRENPEWKAFYYDNPDNWDTSNLDWMHMDSDGKFRVFCRHEPDIAYSRVWTFEYDAKAKQMKYAGVLLSVKYIEDTYMVAYSGMGVARRIRVLKRMDEAEAQEKAKSFPVVSSYADLLK